MRDSSLTVRPSVGRVDQAVHGFDHIAHAAHRLELLGGDFLAGLALDVIDQVDGIDAVDFQVLVEVGGQGHAFGIQLEQFDHGRAQGGEDFITGLHVLSPQADCRAATKAARLATLAKCSRVSLASASILMPKRFWIASPSSSASTESSPRPSPNSGRSAPMSAASMSSRPRASMIRCLISSCKSLIYGELLNEVTVQEFVEFTRGDGGRSLRAEQLRVDIFAYTQANMETPRRNTVPGLGLGQGGRGHADRHGGDDARAAQRDGGGPPMEFGRLPRAGARTFGEDHQGLVAVQGGGGLVEHVQAAAVADVLGGANRPAHIRSE